MTKTAYANIKRMSPEEFTEYTKDMSPEDREDVWLEQATGPLFDMWLRFESVFADRAIDRLNISDEEAERAAKRMEAGGLPAHAAFAYLLRRIPDRRLTRQLFHEVHAVWAAEGTHKPMSIEEVHTRYNKLTKGEA